MEETEEADQRRRWSYSRSSRRWAARKKPDLAKVLWGNSGADVEWLGSEFNLDLSSAARLGGYPGSAVKSE